MFRASEIPMSLRNYNRADIRWNRHRSSANQLPPKQDCLVWGAYRRKGALNTKTDMYRALWVDPRIDLPVAGGIAVAYESMFLLLEDWE